MKNNDFEVINGVLARKVNLAQVLQSKLCVQ